MLEIMEVRMADILERRDDLHVGQLRLESRHRRAAFGQLHLAHLGRHQRYGRVDQDLAREQVGQVERGRLLPGIGHGEDDDIARRRCRAIIRAGDAAPVEMRVEGGRACLRLGGVARSDHDLVAGMGETRGEATAFLAGAADHGDAGKVSHVRQFLSQKRAAG
jgi:hypothetical protein